MRGVAAVRGRTRHLRRARQRARPCAKHPAHAPSATPGTRRPQNPATASFFLDPVPSGLPEPLPCMSAPAFRRPPAFPSEKRAGAIPPPRRELPYPAINALLTLRRPRCRGARSPRETRRFSASRPLTRAIAWCGPCRAALRPTSARTSIFACFFCDAQHICRPKALTSGTFEPQSRIHVSPLARTAPVNASFLFDS